MEQPKISGFTPFEMGVNPLFVSTRRSPQKIRQAFFTTPNRTYPCCKNEIA